MYRFLIGLAILILGYFTYGKFVERVIGTDSRRTPCLEHPDGVDYVPLPFWKNLLIQLLNIAGFGPVIGVILGIKFGSIVFIVLPIGNIIGGATYDMLTGMMSLRSNGASMSLMVREQLGKIPASVFTVFMSLILFVGVAVFVNIPAQLVSGMIPGCNFVLVSAVILIYYAAAALFPVDKIIGKVYPFFGALLIASTFILFAGLMISAFQNPALLEESEAFQVGMFTPEKHQPLLPMLFVTIACGIISGIHATQSPIVARTMVSERQARCTFYGMMVVEGIIGMIWAGATLAIYNLFPEYMDLAPATVLGHISTYFLGGTFGSFVILGVIVLVISSGDTALRCMRLSAAEILGIDQKPLRNRILICAGLVAAVVLLIFWSNYDAKGFGVLWNYFSWSNQVLAATALLAGIVWLTRQGKNFWIAVMPGGFMLFIVLTYILWISPEHGGPVGFGLPLNAAYGIAGVLSAIFVFLAWKRGCDLRKSKGNPAELLKK